MFQDINLKYTEDVLHAVHLRNIKTIDTLSMVFLVSLTL